MIADPSESAFVVGYGVGLGFPPSGTIVSEIVEATTVGGFGGLDDKAGLDRSAEGLPGAT